MEFKDNLYDMMFLRELTSKEICEKTGIARNLMNSFLRGEKEMTTMLTLKRLASVLGCTPRMVTS